MLTVSNEFYSLPSFECRLRSWGYLRGMIDGMESDVWGGIKEYRRELDTADVDMPLMAKVCRSRLLMSSEQCIEKIHKSSFHILEN